MKIEVPRIKCDFSAVPEPIFSNDGILESPIIGLSIGVNIIFEMSVQVQAKLIKCKLKFSCFSPPGFTRPEVRGHHTIWVLFESRGFKLFIDGGLDFFHSQKQAKFTK